MNLSKSLKNNPSKAKEWLESERESLVFCIKRKQRKIIEIDEIINRISGNVPPRL